MIRNRYDKWYIWQPPRSDGGVEWSLQFPLEVADRWWTRRPKGLCITAFSRFEEARDYMLRVQQEGPRV